MMKRRNTILAVLLVALLSSSGVTQQRKSAPARINGNAVRAHIKYLSDDLLEGRGPGARGGDLAAKYIGTQLEALGLKGAGPQGSFYQPVSLVGVKADPQTQLTVEAKERKDARATFKFGDDFVAFTGAQTEE